MKSSEYQSRAEQVVLHTYNRFPVVLDHGNGLITTYCNLAGSPAVQAGQTVEAGEIIGAVGGSAIAESSLEPHLHLEASLNGQVVDPREYLPQ